MDHDDSGARAERFATYIADLGSVLGDRRRHGPMTSYCTGLLMPADRKSVEVPDLIRDGGHDGAGAHGGVMPKACSATTPVDAAFRRQRRLVR